jgi:hypothetical protein
MSSTGTLTAVTATTVADSISSSLNILMIATACVLALACVCTTIACVHRRRASKKADEFATVAGKVVADTSTTDSHTERARAWFRGMAQRAYSPVVDKEEQVSSIFEL